MSKLCGLMAACAVAVLLLRPWPGAAQDKDDKREKVRITTSDGVELNAHFYACLDPKVKNPPTILMLHPLGTGENSSKKAWIALAQTLQTKAAVLTFDFRGHGQSTEVDPMVFWKVPTNVNQIKEGLKAKQTNKANIDFKEFDKAYYSVLVNDIYACRSFLDRKNDTTGLCNTSSIVLVGAESGGTLGAIWLSAEWHRHRLIQNPVNLATFLDTKSEGQDVIACVWLTMAATLGPRDQATPKTIQVASTLQIPLKDRGIPMVFIYGENDEKGKKVAAAALATLPAKSKKTLYSWTDKVEVKKTDLRGTDLLAKSLNVDKAIHGYLFGDAEREGVIANKYRDYTEREFKKTQYQWRVPGTPPGVGIGIPAKTLAYPNDFVFDTFVKYAKWGN